MSTTGWEQMTGWWDEKLGDEGDLWHRTLIDPPLLRFAGEVAGLRVLDLACGNGYLSCRFAHQGATVTGVDANAPLIERTRAREAREPLGITLHVADAADLQMLAEGAFDLAICNMALMDIERADGTIQEAARVLRQGEPLRRQPVTSLFRQNRHLRLGYRDDLSYNRHLAKNEALPRDNGHRPALEAGGRPGHQRAQLPLPTIVAALEEPEPTDEFLAASSQGPWIAKIPLHCVIEAWKIARA